MTYIIKSVYVDSRVNPQRPRSLSLLLGFARGPTILCTNLLCWLKSIVWVKPFPQMLQMQVTIPACCSSCALSLPFILNIFPQVLHLNLGSLCVSI